MAARQRIAAGRVSGRICVLCWFAARVAEARCIDFLLTAQLNPHCAWAARIVRVSTGAVVLCGL